MDEGENYWKRRLHDKKEKRERERERERIRNEIQ